MADREVTERVNIDVRGTGDLKTAATAARGAAGALATLEGMAREAGGAMGVAAREAEQLGMARSGPAALEGGLDGAADSAAGLARQLADARKEAEGLARAQAHANALEMQSARFAGQGGLASQAHAHAREMQDAAAFYDWQRERQAAVFRLAEKEKEHGHAREMARIREEGRARAAAAAGQERGGGGGMARTGVDTGGGSALGRAAEGLLSAASMLGTAAAGLAGVVGRLAAAGLEMAVDAVGFRKSMTKSFDLLSKGRWEGERLYQRGIELADKLGQSPRDMLSGMNDLLGKEFELEGATGALEVLKAMADVRVISPNADIKGLVFTLGQIRSKGKLALEELNTQLGERFSSTAVLEELEKQLGKTRSEVLALISSGKIDPDTGILAVMNAIKTKTGMPLGSAAEEAANGVGGLIERLKGMPQRLLENIDLTPMQGALKNTIAFFNSEGGQKLQAAITRLGSGLVKGLFGGLDGPEGARRIEAIGAGLTKFADKSADALERFQPFLDKTFKYLDKLAGLDTGNIEAAGGVLAEVLSNLPGLSVFQSLEQIGMLAELVEQLATDLEGAGAWIGEKASSLGTALTDGIIGGIRSGAASVVQAVVDMASGAVGAAKRAFGIASPSKEFAWLGEQIPPGLARGMVSNDNAARGAAYGLASSTTSAAQSAIASPSRSPVGTGAGRGGNTFHVSVSIVVQGSDAAAGREAADAAADQLEVRLRRYERRWAEAG